MRRFTPLLLSLLLCATLRLSASTVVPVDLGTMVDRADLIFVGTVIGSESVPTKDRSFAFTYVTFDVDQVLKGIPRSGKTFVLRLPGGESGTDVFEVSGTPRFAMGGQHLLFVEGNEKYLVPLVGWFQGKLDIVPNPISREPVLVDSNGHAIDGIEGKGWRRDGMKLNRDGSLQQPRDPGVAVLSQSGVRIELEKPADIVERAAPVAKVVAELRAYISARKASSRTFRDTQFADSASKATVPATFGFTAARARSVND